MGSVLAMGWAVANFWVFLSIGGKLATIFENTKMEGAVHICTALLVIGSGIILPGTIMYKGISQMGVPKTYLNEKVWATQKSIGVTKGGGMQAIYELKNGGLVSVRVSQGEVPQPDFIYRQN
jgi:hypothetical protein